jgi:hypothetical protein
LTGPNVRTAARRRWTPPTTSGLVEQQRLFAKLRQALREAVHRLTTGELEEKHREEYKRQPVQKGEFDIWENEQAWPDS